MKDERLSFLVVRFGIYYGTVDKKLRVRFSDDGVFAFLGEEPVNMWMILSDFLPETVGMEKEIMRIISGEKDECSILSVNRQTGNEIFFNIYFLRDHREPDNCIVVIKDLTNELLYRQAIQQKKNEIELLHQILMKKNADLDMANQELMKSHDEQFRLNQSLEIKVHERTHQLEESTMLARRLFSQTVNALMLALEKRDTYTVGHQQRVSELACAIAREMRLDEFIVEGIIVAGNLHDIGKIYVPSEFLTKPGDLSEEEFGVMKAHPKIGFDILSGIEFPWPVAAIILQHHERLDGSGYPYGLTEKDILLEAKILSVADVVEAMATMRPYRIAPGLELALEEVKRYSGIRYDSTVAETCIGLFASQKFAWSHLAGHLR
ncbi:MAG: HD domain-containing protein [Spirochaetes bacterium]|nr:HD domain-containing protein [Spirochaetota bacterium]